MGEQGKEALKQQVGEKRAREELADIPDDFCTKRPRHEMTSDVDARRQDERRQKNKEAAEKSRRKKKEEFSKLQTENDQLQQDKCQLVASIGKLKDQLNKASKENGSLRTNIDHLKRWIGKHAKDLGLGKHLQKRQVEEVGLPKAMKIRSEDVLRADPSLHSASLPTDPDLVPLRSASTSPPLSSTSMLSSVVSPDAVSPISKLSAPSLAPLYPQIASSPPLSTHDCFQPVGIRTVLTFPQVSLSLPQVVEQPLNTHHYSHAGRQEEVIYPGGQPLVYLSKDTVFVVQRDDDRQPVMVAPKAQPDIRLDEQEVQYITMASQPVPQISEEAPAACKPSVEAPEVQVGSEEGPGIQEPSVDTPEMQERNPDTTEVQEHTVDSSLESQSSAAKAQETQVVSDESSDWNGALLSDMIQNQAAARVSAEAKDIGNVTPDSRTVIQSNLASSIELLLKLGYKIQVPEDVAKSRLEGGQ